MEEIIALLLGFLAFLLIIALVAYVLNGLIYTKLAKKAGVQNWGWAWAPCGLWYIGAKVGQLGDYVWLIPIGLGLAAGMADDAAFLFFIGAMAYTIYNDKKIMERFGDNGNLAFLHLIPGIGSIIVFVMIAVLAFGSKQVKPLVEDKTLEQIPE